MSNKYFIDNAPEEEGTQFCLTHSLTSEQATEIEKLPSAVYNEDHVLDQEYADNVFINSDDADKQAVKDKLINFGFDERTLD
jgi:hypothetical protein